MCVINYNKKNSLIRQKFAIAHSLGHYLIHGLNDNEKYIDPPDNFSMRSYILKEREANLFAVNILVPEETLETTIIDTKNISVEKLANIYEVSQVCMEYSLRAAGWIKM